VTPTATQSAGVSSELRQLERQLEEAYAALQEAKRQRDAFDAATEAKRAELTQRQHSHPEEFEGVSKAVKPDTKAAALRDAIRPRMAENPHAENYEAALAKFHEVDSAVQTFKRERVSDRLAQAAPDNAQAVATIREAFELLRCGCELYRVGDEEVRAIAADTPTLQRRKGMYGHDGRVDDWYRLALAALDSEIAPPDLTPLGWSRVENNG
jgi:hypothetical protein